ncbi:hypothetical protein Tsubulata_045685 [Turnera subulata]|uniref:Agenet domain-containing protein n=1 Tax=Turnera subulata TaxID=218843 RepID=A0A9Q0GJ86_9ROSI|nr:hypothetical protein Tsubulata_045685 [Turnera subulata]
MASPHHLASASADADPPLVPPTVPPRRRFKMKAQRWKSPHGSLPARRKRPPFRDEDKTRVPNPGSTFEHGTVVKVTSDVEGFRGAWFTATIVGPAGQDSLMVQYLKLVTDDMEVDAWFNEGWWEGTVLEVLDGSKYVVYFSYSCESMVIEHSELRPHQDWVDGKWIEGFEVPSCLPDDDRLPFGIIRPANEHPLIKRTGKKNEIMDDMDECIDNALSWIHLITGDQHELGEVERVQKALDFFAPRVPTKYYPAEAESVPAIVEEQVHSITPTLSKPQEAAERPPAEPSPGTRRRGWCLSQE